MADTPIVKPQPISGFPEWLPEEKLVEERLLRIIREEFERYGFAPLETSAVERKEVLRAKGVVEKEIYALSRLAAEGDGGDPTTEMALHFDLTVPMARYVAQNFARLTFPFRRYQIQKVWRGERPQAGRFREFYQCDIDIVGNERLGLLADAEIPLVINAIFERIGIGRFLIRINNRKILQGFLEGAGVPDPHFATALRLIDALEKIGEDKVLAGLESEIGLDADRATSILAFLTDAADLDRLRAYDGGARYQEGVAELAEVVEGLAALGMPADAWTVDLTIARGLDYYTGTVYETRLVDHPQIGSICSGGRYDDLASSFTKNRLPGVGISIGLTRMLSRLFDAGLLTPGPQTPASVLVTVMDRARLADCLAAAAELRGAGIATEVYTEPKKIGQQLKYADQKGFHLAVLIGEDEAATGRVVLKNLATAEQTTHDRADLVDAINDRIGIVPGR
ncbi:MAG: histidine--tRNA ligase [Alphaproteobacteria bacterium]|jgi:histidyl-tRNA synthetase|nr:histidine--tRNA ligase [Alphaproteobacteria bacterium]